ncbi:hypothetical protein JW979_14790, partial [bacterium]|nr:hypothetical protein [candidate division CSSED10-310 bacterium]
DLDEANREEEVIIKESPDLIAHGGEPVNESPPPPSHEDTPGSPSSVMDLDEIDKDLLGDLTADDLFAADTSTTLESEETDKTSDEKITEVPSDEEIDKILDSRHTEAAPEAAIVKPTELDPEEEKRHEKARRIARVIINDIRNYNPEKLADGIRSGNIMKTLGVEIERGRQLYIKRVPQDIARVTNYYRESLIKILADGRTDLFGW